MPPQVLPPVTPAIATSAGDFLSATDISSVIGFLTGDQATGSSVAYKATAPGLEGLILPLSYAPTAKYFGDYVCAQPGADCKLTADMIKCTKEDIAGCPTD